MGKIAIVTDSNSGITQKEGKELGISVIPMPFYINEELYFEDITLTQDEFYQKLNEDEDIKTSQPAPGDVLDLWEKLLEDHDEIVHIAMSSGLSSSCATAAMLADDYDGKVQVVDNQRISVTQRQSVLDAAKLAEEGKSAKEIKDISGFTHGVGWCAPQQGACKLTLNVKDGIIQEALVETLGCSGMTHSAAMASEILPGKTILEALNTDLVCDAINTAMRELFLQIVYGRTQSAFSENGLAVGAGLEDLGKGLRSQVGTMYGTLAKGPRYLEMAEGYVTGIALDDHDEIIGYQFVNLGKFTDFIKAGDTPNDAWEKAKGQYGRVDDAAKIIDPRKE